METVALQPIVPGLHSMANVLRLFPATRTWLRVNPHSHCEHNVAGHLAFHVHN